MPTPWCRALGGGAREVLRDGLPHGGCIVFQLLALGHQGGCLGGASLYLGAQTLQSVKPLARSSFKLRFVYFGTQTLQSLQSRDSSFGECCWLELRVVC